MCCLVSCNNVSNVGYNTYTKLHKDKVHVKGNKKRACLDIDNVILVTKVYPWDEPTPKMSKAMQTSLSHAHYYKKNQIYSLIAF